MLPTDFRPASSPSCSSSRIGRVLRRSAGGSASSLSASGGSRPSTPLPLVVAGDDDTAGGDQAALAELRHIYGDLGLLTATVGGGSNSEASLKQARLDLYATSRSDLHYELQRMRQRRAMTIELCRQIDRREAIVGVIADIRHEVDNKHVEASRNRCGVAMGQLRPQQLTALAARLHASLETLIDLSHHVLVKLAEWAQLVEQPRPSLARNNRDDDDENGDDDDDNHDAAADASSSSIVGSQQARLVDVCSNFTFRGTQYLQKLQDDCLQIVGSALSPLIKKTVSEELLLLSASTTLLLQGNINVAGDSAASLLQRRRFTLKYRQEQSQHDHSGDDLDPTQVASLLMQFDEMTADERRAQFNFRRNANMTMTAGGGGMSGRASRRVSVTSVASVGSNSAGDALASGRQDERRNQLLKSALKLRPSSSSTDGYDHNTASSGSGRHNTNSNNIPSSRAGLGAGYSGTGLSSLVSNRNSSNSNTQQQQSILVMEARASSSMLLSDQRPDSASTFSSGGGGDVRGGGGCDGGGAGSQSNNTTSTRSPLPHHLLAAGASMEGARPVLSAQSLANLPLKGSGALRPASSPAMILSSLEQQQQQQHQHASSMSPRVRGVVNPLLLAAPTSSELAANDPRPWTADALPHRARGGNGNSGNMNNGISSNKNSHMSSSNNNNMERMVSTHAHQRRLDALKFAIEGLPSSLANGGALVHHTVMEEVMDMDDEDTFRGSPSPCNGSFGSPFSQRSRCSSAAAAANTSPTATGGGNVAASGKGRRGRRGRGLGNGVIDVMRIGSIDIPILDGAHDLDLNLGADFDADEEEVEGDEEEDTQGEFEEEVEEYEEHHEPLYDENGTRVDVTKNKKRTTLVRTLRSNDNNSNNNNDSSINTLRTTPRTRVVTMLKKYAPDKLDDMEALIAERGGDVESLLQHLVQQHGPEPTSKTTVMKCFKTTSKKAKKKNNNNASSSSQQQEQQQKTTTDDRTRIVAMLQTFEPEKLSQMDAMIAEHGGDPAALLQRLQQQHFGDASSGTNEGAAAHSAAEAAPQSKFAEFERRYETLKRVVESVAASHLSLRLVVRLQAQFRRLRTQRAFAQARALWSILGPAAAGRVGGAAPPPGSVDTFALDVFDELEYGKYL